MKNLITSLKALVSNQAAIDCRKNKWYVTLAMFVLIVFLPWIPMLSTGYTSNTASLFLSTSSKNYDIDKGFKSVMGKEYFKNGVVINKSSDGKYSLSYQLDSYANTDEGAFDNEYNGTNTKELFKATFHDESGHNNHALYTTGYAKNYTQKSYDYYFDCISVANSDVIDPAKTSSASSTSSSVEYESNGYTYFLENFYFPTMSKTDENYLTFLNNFVASVVLNMTSSSTAETYPHSYCIWAKDFILVAVYPLKASKSSISASGSYSGDISSGFGADDVADNTKFYDYLSNSGKLTLTEAYNTSFVNYLNQAGRPAYLKSVWYNIGIVSAVVAGCVLVGSLILLFLNKRKSSIYRDSNYFHCLAEAVYFVSSGSVIAFVFGFFASNYVYVIIGGAALIRIVFAANKICPPPTDAGQGGSKPLYQARS